VAGEAFRVILSIVLVVGGIASLYLGAEWLIRGATHLGARARVPPIVIGLTVVSLGTSAPEFVVCVMAALQGNPDLATGNVLGSNLANVGLILGIAALYRPLEVASPVIRRDIPWMLVVTFLVLPLFLSLELRAGEGAILLAVLAAYLLFLVRAARRHGVNALGEAARRMEPLAPASVKDPGGLALPLALVVVGSLFLMAGGRAVVTGATAVGQVLGVPELLVGLSVVAVGTSLPELAATMVAAVRKEADLAVGNIVGSNLFNLTFVLGGTALVAPIPIPTRVLTVDYPLVLVLSLLLFPLALNQRRIGRGEGALLLLVYALGWVWILSAQG
jgi:cation:H+ antiporter